MNLLEQIPFFILKFKMVENKNMFHGRFQGNWFRTSQIELNISKCLL